MHELEPASYGLAHPLFADLDVHLAVKALLAGNVPGHVYVDDPARPRAALAQVGPCFYVGGSSHAESFNRAVGQFFTATVYPQALAAGQEGFYLKCTAASWTDQVDVLLPGKLPLRQTRHYYVGQEVRHDWRAMLPPDITLRLVDRALLEEDLGGLDDLREEMQSERPSVDEFLDKSFGFVPIRGQEVIGWCLSEYNCGDRCEVGIATAEGYRRQGLATAIASAFVEYARAHGIAHVGWHCDAGNAGSNATARKLGFTHALAYPAYLCLYDDVVQLAVHGDHAFRQQRYAEAAGWYERALQRGEAPTWAYINCACAHAMSGGAEQALRRLHGAVDRGFADAAYLRTRRWFEGLRGTEGWERLLERVGQLQTPSL
jgi:RimJ/RimL family protein N-acetyltransferase